MRVFGVKVNNEVFAGGVRIEARFGTYKPFDRSEKLSLEKGFEVIDGFSGDLFISIRIIVSVDGHVAGNFDPFTAELRQTVIYIAPVGIQIPPNRKPAHLKVLRLAREGEVSHGLPGNREPGLEEGQDTGGPGARRDDQALGFQRPVRRLHANGCSGRIDLEHAPFSVDVDLVSTAELDQRREGVCCRNDAGGLVVEDARCPLETELGEQAPGLSDFDQFDLYLQSGYGAGVGFVYAARRAEETAGCGVNEGAVRVAFQPGPFLIVDDLHEADVVGVLVSASSDARVPVGAPPGVTEAELFDEPEPPASQPIEVIEG